MADVTPPVGLAAYAASAISRADPIKTGIQAFYYEIRTAILPIVFIFNPELLLIGIKNIWHGCLVFIVSLIAILSFTSATQGWLIAKLRWYEIIALLFVTVCMFRPDFIMNSIYPEYAPFSYNYEDEIEFEHDRKIRIHITRYTDYGERYKLYVFIVKKGSLVSLKDITGLELESNNNGYADVVNMEFMGAAEKKGIQFYDEVTKVSISSLNRPDKEYIYIIGLFLLILVFYTQKKSIKTKF